MSFLDQMLKLQSEQIEELKTMVISHVKQEIINQIYDDPSKNTVIISYYDRKPLYQFNDEIIKYFRSEGFIVLNDYVHSILDEDDDRKIKGIIIQFRTERKSSL
jgi:hypothetical protein